MFKHDALRDLYTMCSHKDESSDELKCSYKPSKSIINNLQYQVRLINAKDRNKQSLRILESELNDLRSCKSG